MGDVKELLPPEQRELVAWLESMLEAVEAGDVVGIGYVALRKGDDPLQGFVGPTEKMNVHELISGLETIKFRLLNHQYGCGDVG